MKKLMNMYKNIYFAILRIMVIHYFKTNINVGHLVLGTGDVTWDISIIRNKYPERIRERGEQ